MKNIALTGGAGLIGRALRHEISSHFERVVVIDLQNPGPLQANETWIQANICDLAAMTAALQGVDGLVHMAGLREENTLDAILSVNAAGTYTTYEAALVAGVRRIVYGSSNHVTGFYPRHTLVSPDMPMRPDTRYALSKCWGELVAGLYYDKHGIETLSIRIGNASPVPADTRALSMWISARDLGNLVMLGLRFDDLKIRTVYGVSASSRPWWDNTAAHEMGYIALDSIEDFVEPGTFDGSPSADAVVEYFQGGMFCTMEHDGMVRPR